MKAALVKNEKQVRASSGSVKWQPWEKMMVEASIHFLDTDVAVKLCCLT